MISSSSSLQLLQPFISFLFHFLLLQHSLISHHQCHASPSPAGVEAILDPLGDLVQVAPSLASHQEQAEKLSESLIKPSKTPSGTVKCSCQTVSSEFQDNFPSDSPKTVEIEIYKDSFAAASEGEDREDKIRTPEGKEDRIDNDEESLEDESQLELVNLNRKPVRNSFSLEDDEISPGVVIREPEEQTPFLSFLSQLVSSSAQLQQKQVASQPENLEIEADHKESDDDHASLKLFGGGDGGDGDSYNVNAANHRLFETVHVKPSALLDSSRKTDYQAYRTADLIGAVAVPSSLDEVSSEKMDKEGGNGNDRFFLWDFIYADHAANNLGKKRELLQLGTVTDPFKGPRRRRRRRRRSLRGTGNDPHVVYVYPVGYQPDVKPSEEKEEERSDQGLNELFIQENQTKSNQGHQKPIQMRSDAAEVVDIDDHGAIHQAMQEAMHRAWEQYGPKGLDAPPVTPAPPAPVVMIAASDQPPQPPLPYTQNADQRTQQHKEIVQKQQQQQQQQPNPHDLVYYSPPRPFLFIDRIFNPFQPMTSEWDKHVTTFEGPQAPPPQPGLFSRLMASYIDFEVNNHETADLMRRVVFAMFVGFLIAGWIALGAALGFVPLKKLLAFVAGTHYDSDAAGTKRLDKGKEFQARDATISDLTDKILLSLDADWLKRLEDRVMGTGGGDSQSLSTKIPTQVFCCILPDEEANGMVKCQVLRGSSHHHSNKKKTSAFKCISDLIYNFHFGPREDEVGEEQDNIVNIKSKANNGDTTVIGDNQQEEPDEWNENSKSVEG